MTAAAAALVVAATVTYWDVAHPDVDPASCEDRALSVVSVVESAGGIVHDLSTRTPTADQVAADTRGVLEVLGMYGAVFEAEVRGGERPARAVAFEARQVAVQEAAAAACVAPGAGAGSGVVAVAATGGPVGKPGPWGGHENGRIPTPALCPLAGHSGHMLRCDAAAAFAALEAAYGSPIGVTDSYRTYDAQVDLARRKGLYSQGGLAARPGTSNHGWGLALDLDLSSGELAWMRGNAGRFGFSTIPREPWHWELSGAVAAG